MEVCVKIFLKSLRIENFKSYIGKNEAGPCHPNLNAIIGPNGSGKSNLLDAILFVLGRKAIELRFKCLSDIISFSKIKKPLCASVTVNFRFDRPNQKEWTLDIVEFYISRKIFKKSLSVYFLNGKELKFFELIKVVSKKRITFKNDRFLVQQGEIEKISMMRPSGKNLEEIGTLEYSEGVFGTIRYLYILNKKKKTRNLIKLEIVFLQKNPLSTTILKYQKNFIYGYKKTTEKRISLLKRVLKLFQIFGVQHFCLETCFSEKTIKTSILMNLLNKDKNLLKSSKKVFCGNFLKVNNIKEKSGKIEKLLQLNFLHEKKLYLSYKEKKKFFTKSQTLNIAYFKTSHAEMLENETNYFKINQKITQQGCFLKKISNLISKRLKLFFRKISIYSICNFIHHYCKKKREIDEKTEELFLKNDQTVVFLEKLNFLSTQFFNKNLEKVDKCKKKRSNKFFEIYFSIQKIKMVSENTNLFCFFENFSLANNTGLKERVTPTSKKYSPLNNHLKFSNTIQTKFGILDQIGSLGYVNFRLGLPLISVLKGDIRSFLIDTVSNSLSIVELFHKEKTERTKLLVSEKIKPFLPRKKNRKSKKLFDKIFTNKIFEHVFHYLVQETLIVENLSDGIREVFDSVNRKRVVTIKGEIIEKSGVFSGGKLRTDYLDFINRSVKNTPKWIDDYNFFSKQSFIIRNLQLEKNVKRTLQTQGFRTFKKSNSFSDFQSFSQLENIFFFKRKIKFIKIDFINLFFEKFPLILTKNDNTISKLKKKTKNLTYGSITIRHLFWFKLISESTIFELIRKKNPKEKSQNLMWKKKEKKAATAYVSAKLVSKNFMIKKIKNFYGTTHNQTEFFKRFIRPMSIVWKFNFYYTNSLNLKKKFLYFFLEDFQEFKYHFYQVKSFFTHSVFYLKRKGESIIKQKLRIKYELKRVFMTLKKFEGFSLDFIKKRINFQEIKWKKFLDVVPSSNKKTPRTLFLTFGLILTCQDDSNLKRVLPKNIKNFFEKRKIIVQKFKKKKVCIRSKLVSQNSKQIHFQRLTDFIQNLLVFEQNLNLTYCLFSHEGIVDVELLDENDPFSKGLLLSPKHPEKSWKTISQLSGGEKTLGSLAVVFSLQISKPVPWYLFDEIDAALDFKNVSIISSYIYFSSHHSQILIISLRSNMFRSANHIFGVTKINDETKIITLKV